MTERKQQSGHGQDADRRTGHGAARETSPDAGNAAISAGHVATPQAALVLQRRLGNAAYGLALQRTAVVQRMGEDARERAEAGLQAGGWVPDETGYGYTRAPQAEHQAQGHEGHAQQGQGHAQGQAQAQAHAEGSSSTVALSPAGRDRMTLYVHARKNASFSDPGYLNQVGHAWVTFNRNGTFESSIGFYPVNAMLDPENPMKSVPGHVTFKDHEPEHASTTMSVELTAPQYDKAREYIEAHATHNYSVLRYNCTDFAAGVYKAATGHSVPGGANWFLPNNPNDLHAGMKKHNREHAGQR